MLLGISRLSLVSLDHSFILSWWWWWWWGRCWYGCCCNYFSMPLFGDFFPTLYKRLKHNKGEDFIWAALAPCPILLVRETILFSLLTRLKWTPYAIVIYCYVYMYSHYRPIKYSKINKISSPSPWPVSNYYYKCLIYHIQASGSPQPIHFLKTHDISSPNTDENTNTKTKTVTKTMTKTKTPRDWLKQ